MKALHFLEFRKKTMKKERFGFPNKEMFIFHSTVRPILHPRHHRNGLWKFWNVMMMVAAISSTGGRLQRDHGRSRREFSEMFWREYMGGPPKIGLPWVTPNYPF